MTPSVNVTNDKQSYGFNEAVTMSCKHGFIGRTVISQCTEVDTWSKNSPTCTSKSFHSKHVKIDRRLFTNTAIL